MAKGMRAAAHAAHARDMSELLHHLLYPAGGEACAHCSRHKEGIITWRFHAELAPVGGQGPSCLVIQRNLPFLALLAHDLDEGIGRINVHMPNRECTEFLDAHPCP